MIHKYGSRQGRAIIPIGTNDGITECEWKLEAGKDFENYTDFGISSSLDQEEEAQLISCRGSTYGIANGVQCPGHHIDGFEMNSGSVMKMQLDMNIGICSMSVDGSEMKEVWNNLKGKTWYPCIRLYYARKQKISIVSFKKYNQ
eukprot:TRINITY_DN301590_c0_g1_i2.p1 TRINITY_DN301590_c0_g1~~TRINITY_DN301590_c0_g1_i2.p1  ORF type:complete len:144 (-),score=27.39 TRINITY_DN301590_c0_g1_i2:235-666(-)